ncbi:MAG: TetR/AcrR family transcriptional regulator C-terminal domain-containing protein, partial [Sedimenticolaceae bacterium]
VALLTLTRRCIDPLFDPEVIAMHRLVMGESASHPRIAELFFDSGPRRSGQRLPGYCPIAGRSVAESAWL